jgi:hypothetical protein
MVDEGGAVRLDEGMSGITGARVVHTRPARDLWGWVRDYTAYRERLSGPVTRRELPAMDVVLLVSFADSVRITGSVDGGRTRPCSSDRTTGL